MINRPLACHTTARARMLRKWALVLSTLAILGAGCTADVNIRGNTVSQDKLTKIKPGVQDREAVRDLLGSPTNVATFSDDTWYYISQKDRSVAFSKPLPLSRSIVAITFDKAGRVAKVKKYTLANARKIVPTDLKTPSPGREPNLIEQLIGNIGRFEQPSTQDNGD